MNLKCKIGRHKWKRERLEVYEGTWLDKTCKKCGTKNYPLFYPRKKYIIVTHPISGYSYSIEDPNSEQGTPKMLSGPRGGQL